MMLKDLVLALSLSNLCFINSWRALLMPSSVLIYHLKVPRPAVDYLALILDVFLLASLFFIVIRIIRSSRKAWVKKCTRIGFILMLTVPLYSLVLQFDSPAARQLMLPLFNDKTVVRQLFASIPLTICLFVLVFGFLRIDKTVRIAVVLLLMLSPFVLITFSQAAFSAAKDRRISDGPTAPPVARTGNSKSIRMLWLVFDELDFRVAFQDRPSAVKLPELDRLIGQSLSAKNAYPPAGETFLTMPALITGKLVSEARRRGTNELMIKFGDDTAAVPWSTYPNIFSRARELGLNTALVGWYHPYCRVLSGSLTRCSWEGVSPEEKQGITPYMYTHARKAVFPPPISAFVLPQPGITGDPVRKKHVASFNSIYRDALQAVSDSELDVVMIHFPIPHHPNIYNRSEGRIWGDFGRSYLDNLELTDRTLGDLRRAMESSGTWDRTVVLLTSDHWWRAHSVWKKHSALTPEDEAAFGDMEDRRVPFILKLTGDVRKGTTFVEPFNTVVTHDLLLAILEGKVSDIQAAAEWLNRNRSIGRSPYDERSFRNVP